MEMLREYVRNIAVYVIFMALAGAIIPEGKLKSYVDLTMGIILVLILVSPVAGLLGADFPGALAGLGLQFERRVMAGEFAHNDAEHNALILSIYRDNLREQARRLIESFRDFVFINARFEIGEEERNFGEIKGIWIELAERRDTPEQRMFGGLIRIEPVSIRIGTDIPLEITPENSNDNLNEDERIIRIKNAISDFYMIPSSNINIIVQKTY